MKQNNKQVLKMIADGLFDSRENLLKRYAEIPVDERDNNSWWYLHGQLESDVHFDKATAVNCKTAGYSRETINWKEICGDTVTKVEKNGSLRIHRMHINGEVPVEIEGIASDSSGQKIVRTFSGRTRNILTGTSADSSATLTTLKLVSTPEKK